MRSSSANWQAVSFSKKKVIVERRNVSERVIDVRKHHWLLMRVSFAHCGFKTMTSWRQFDTWILGRYTNEQCECVKSFSISSIIIMLLFQASLLRYLGLIGRTSVNPPRKTGHEQQSCKWAEGGIWTTRVHHFYHSFLLLQEASASLSLKQPPDVVEVVLGGNSGVGPRHVVQRRKVVS